MLRLLVYRNGYFNHPAGLESAVFWANGEVIALQYLGGALEHPFFALGVRSSCSSAAGFLFGSAVSGFVSGASAKIYPNLQSLFCVFFVFTPTLIEYLYFDKLLLLPIGYRFVTSIPIQRLPFVVIIDVLHLVFLYERY